MKILILGASGFIGSNLTKHLLKKNYEVYGTSRKKINLKKKNFYNIILDVKKKKDFNKLSKKKFNFIVYLAAFTRPSSSISKKKEVFNTNIEGLRNTINYFKRSTPKSKFIFISSSAVYEGLKIKKNIIEKYNLPMQKTPYGISKYRSEKLLFKLCKNNKIIIVRPFAIIGADKKKDVCSDIINQFISSKNYTNVNIKLGNTKAVRDFIYIEDFVSAIYLLLTKGSNKEIYNLCSSKGTKIKTLCKKISKIFKKKFKMTNYSNLKRSIDTNILVGNNKKIKSLGWRPKYNLEDSLKKIIYYRLKKTKYRM